MDLPNDLVAQLLAALEERGAPDAIVLADLLRAEKNLVEALGVVRRLIDTIVRQSSPSDLT